MRDATRHEDGFEEVTRVQFDHVRGDLGELKTRVGALEATLARGVLLLVANLAGVVVMLARELAGR